MENNLVFWLSTCINIAILDIPRSYEEGKVCYGAKFHEIKSLENFDFYFRLRMNMYYFKIEKIQLKYFQEVRDKRSTFPF